ncbi:hypothetical protein HJC23_008063 [Cyclotella cryptica]|uniref:Uncharacterized protein n=1 Tax=Cyclotella cryptica TaxID=29204 RepID=A0ABD3NU74_9STRA
MRHLYILDPVYGVLRSMERIQPYRLETGCKGVIEEGGPSTKKESLCSFWNESITAYMRNRMTPTSSVDCGSILVNVASDEYSSSIDILHKGRVVAVHTKRARGLMARYFAEQDAQSLSDVSEFGLEGYRCVAVGESGDGSKQLWETVNVVGENIQVVQMLFDRDVVPGPPSMAKTKRKDDYTECNSDKRIRSK